MVGTWVLLVYLMIALTGLWWSFDWHRSGMTRLLGGTTSEQATAKAGRGPLDLGKVQATLYVLEGVRQGYVNLRLPANPGKPLTARVQGANTAHDRAQDILQIDPASGVLLGYEPYASRKAGGKAMVSVFALHSGSFFGLPGRIVVMLSSLAMLVFFITGWMLYLDRRRKKREVRASRLPMAMPGGVGQSPWLIAFASQRGFAEQLAWRAAAQLQARVRRNAGFHRFPEHAPMLLIGNGTGIAGLRSLLREAALQGDRGHWLVFGERTRAFDQLYRDEIAARQRDGHLAQVDLVFSRDADGGGYVQHRLRAAPQALQAWVAMGGSIYVCGSLHGMADGVDAVLREVLGEDQVDVLLGEGRYRRDVY